MKVTWNKEWNQYLFIFLLIIIPLFLLNICYQKYVEKFTNEQEDFMNLSSLFGLDTPKPEIEPEGKVIKSNQFPPLPEPNKNIQNMDLQKKYTDKDGEFKGADNDDLLKQIMPIDKVKNLLKPDDKNKELNKDIQKSVTEKSMSSDGLRGGVKEVSMITPTKKIEPPLSLKPTIDISNLLGKCNFYNDSCPSGYYSLGAIGLEGLPSGITMTCGDVTSKTSAKLVATIKGGSISEVFVADGGSGYNPKKNYELKIVGGGGRDAELEAIIGDDGKVKVVKVKDGGRGYKETPKIEIQNEKGGKCELCCKKN